VILAACLFAAPSFAQEAGSGIAATAAAPAPSAAPPAPGPAPVAQPASPPGNCVDEELRGQLVGGRHYRGVQPRLFTKAFRHELSILGGWLASDANDGAPWYGGAYTFHFSEELGLEASVGFSRARARLADTLQQRFPQPIEVYRNDRRVRQYLGTLYWSLAYGKMRWMGGAISRFDFHIALGGGVADDEISRGLLGTGGIGLKIYFTSWLGLRLEMRDQISSQKILDETRIVNDLLFFGGLSVFFPFHG
jgi:outer membrane beta-barrel protein